MRVRLGRPDLRAYASRFDVPPAQGAFGVTFLGVASVLLDDGESAVMTDGFFSRPPLRQAAFGRIQPDLVRIDSALARTGVERLEADVPVHTHYDHALDSTVVAERTGAVLVGGESASHIGCGHGLPEGRIRVATPGDPMTYGAFTLTLVKSRLCPPDSPPGTVVAVGARRVVLTHWDDFFRPLDKELRALPYVADDLDVTMRVLDELSAQQGVPVHFPALWQREDPWAAS